MMKAKEIRQIFLDFFKEKQHQIVPSAPIVAKNDPTLMFTNAGMNQFKDYFLGNKQAKHVRVADTQKCMRVSGKHNDLEEVGVDTYHHTMFEMLGNWSFGDYFKQEAIDWAWELLTDRYQLPPDRLYATIFEGDAGDNLEEDSEAYTLWTNYLPKERIIKASKKDNFWEMGETGPCGPCSEIHVDLRSDEDREKIDGATLVNQDHPEVIEIWNLVFIQFNRKADKSLELLPDKHVDTGMGFERLCMALQGKTSSYDTDLFTPIISQISALTGFEYGKELETDIAMRVIADHIRAISFAITDGQSPSNTGAGYVIRRILRRAVRYYYSYLNRQEPMLYLLLPTVVEQFTDIFPELKANLANLEEEIKREENQFLRTLKSGLKRLSSMEEQLKKEGKTVLDGREVFVLYDTYGFPKDLTRLITSEKGISVDEAGFKVAMEEQKQKGKKDANKELGDWVNVRDFVETEFVGYDELETDSQVIRYRQIKQKKKTSYQLVLNVTPFYAESGGQAGDEGMLVFGEEKIGISDTQKENGLIVHYTNKLPSDINQPCRAIVHQEKRTLTTKNHTATHLLHAALREVLGDHVEQRGSSVTPASFRFDFSHHSKISYEDLERVEKIVNEKIRENIPLQELRNIPIEEAKAMGAMALFGEKYGDAVRVIIFDKYFSVELCGGTHVKATGEIGFCKVTTETSIAAGIRRIEAITGPAAFEEISSTYRMMHEMRQLLKSSQGLLENVRALVEENPKLKKEVERMEMEQAGVIKNKLKTTVKEINGIHFIGTRLEVKNADMVKKIAFDLRKEVSNLFLVIGAEINSKAHLTLMFDDALVQAKELNAGKLIRELAKNIKGGGGGQAFYASAGGKDPQGIDKAISEAEKLVETL